MALLSVVPVALWLGFYLIIDLATVWLEASPQSIISHCASTSVIATMIAVCKVANTFSYFLLGWLARFYEPLGPARYRALTALLPLVGLALMMLLDRRIAQVLSQAAATVSGDCNGVRSAARNRLARTARQKGNDEDCTARPQVTRQSQPNHQRVASELSIAACRFPPAARLAMANRPFSRGFDFMAVKKLAFALVATLGAMPSWAQTPQAVAPEARNFMIGKIKVTALHDGGLSIPNDGKTFGVDAGASAVASVLRANGQPTDAIPVSINSLLVRVSGHIVLIDTGLGAKANSVLIASLAAAGIAPGDVTDVLITHTHGDHVGGLVDSGGRIAFPNAKVRMATAEWVYMKSQPNVATLVAAINPKVATFAPGSVVIPGIRSVDIPGHTPGHVGYEITSGNQRLLDIGDTAHSSFISLAMPDWTMGFDGNKAVAKKSRRTTLTRLSENHALIFAPHFPYPAVGTVAAKGNGFVWVPAAPSKFTN